LELEEHYMEVALELACRGKGTTSPNPMVGAVVVKQGEVVGAGFHQELGGPHAEVIALKNAGVRAKGSTLYVNLEPCSHYGRTPPCTEAIIRAGIKKVVVAMQDPNPEVSGAGIEKLLSSGIEVKKGILEEKARQLNEFFIKYISTGLPFVVLKWAMTLDGKIATRTGDSRWISGESSRELVHHLRHQVDGIIAGIGTVLKDDPLLTTRIEEGRDAARIVVDTYGQMPRNARVVNPSSFAPTLWMVGEDTPLPLEKEYKENGVEIFRLPKKDDRVCLTSLLKLLGEKEITSVMVEGGGTLNYGFFAEDLVDKVYAFVAPLICGGEEAVTPVEGKGTARLREAWKLENINLQRFGDDYLLTGYPRRR